MATAANILCKNIQRAAGGMCWAVLWLGTSCALGGILPVLYVGNLAPVRDQYGRVMRGAADSTEAPARSRVELRIATDGVILPPSLSGEAHPCNPLVDDASVGGIGQNAIGNNSGMFCLTCCKRPAAGTLIFARVFNAPVATQATFYADSAAAVVPASAASLVLAFGMAKPLDVGDDDNDGLNNSWEQALGIDGRPTSDYDEDGMSDLDEMLSGTDPADSNSILRIRAINKAACESAISEDANSGGTLAVVWDSVPGKRYRLECAAQLAPDPLTGIPYEAVPVGNIVTAGAHEYQMEESVCMPPQNITGVFRIRMVPGE